MRVPAHRHRDAAEARGWAEERAAGTARRCSVGSCQAGRRMGLDVKTPKSLSHPPSRPACSTEDGAPDWIRERQGRWGVGAMEPAGSLLHQSPAWSPQSQARLESAEVALCSPGPTDHSAAMNNHSYAHAGRHAALRTNFVPGAGDTDGEHVQTS